MASGQLAPAGASWLGTRMGTQQMQLCCHGSNVIKINGFPTDGDRIFMETFWQFNTLPWKIPMFQNAGSSHGYSCYRNIPCNNRTSVVIAQLCGSPALDMLSWDDFNLAPELWSFPCDGLRLDMDCLHLFAVLKLIICYWVLQNNSSNVQKCMVHCSCLFWYGRFPQYRCIFCCQYTCDVQWPFCSLPRPEESAENLLEIQFPAYLSQIGTSDLSRAVVGEWPVQLGR